MYIPDTDGIDHINIYSKGKTELGRLLTNFAYSPFEYLNYGRFNSVEAFWYYYLTGCKYEHLKGLYGFNAKQEGKKLNLRKYTEEDKEIILEAIRCKLRQNRNILNLLEESCLPLTHYYAYGNSGNYKIYNMEEYSWITDEISRIRDIIKGS